jgi:hypothetical protein
MLKCGILRSLMRSDSFREEQLEDRSDLLFVVCGIKGTSGGILVSSSQLNFRRFHSSDELISPCHSLWAAFSQTIAIL